MSEKYPTWLTGHVKEWAQKRLPTVTLCSTTGNELLEVCSATVRGHLICGAPASES